MNAGTHVLLVEDDPLTLFNTQQSLRRSQHVLSVTIAVDGRDALDRLRSGVLAGAPLVVVTDLSMPRMSGLELLSAIRAEPELRDLPVILLTRSIDEDDLRVARSLDADYIMKSGRDGHITGILAWFDAHAIAGG